MAEKKKKFLNEWWGQFLTSILGTAIGLGLTVGVDRVVENHNHERSQRLTAMMVIHDIDEIATALQQKRDNEERLFKATLKATYSLEDLDSVSIDTLMMAFAFIAINEKENNAWTKDAKERMFTTSIEVYNNLSSTRFTDNVQECYGIRRKLLANYEGTLMTYQKPIGREDMKRLVMACNNEEFSLSSRKFTRKGLARILKEKFSEKQTLLYMYAFEKRDEELIESIDKLRDLNNENKFLMNITDEDMAAFVESTEHATQPLTEKTLVGNWKSEDVGGTVILELNQDMSFLHQDVVDFSYVNTERKDGVERFVRVQSFVPVDLKGNWGIQGDSIVLKYNMDSIHIGELVVNYDDLPAKFLQKNKSDIEEWQDDTRDDGEFMQELREYIPKQKTFAAELDITGNILLLDHKRMIRQKRK